MNIYRVPAFMASIFVLFSGALLVDTARRATPLHTQPAAAAETPTVRPALRFSTYLGGSEIDISSAIAIDRDGYVYVAGQTLSPDFPTRNAALPYQGGLFVGSDVFIAKLSPGGDSLVYATYLGGMGEELVAALAVDDQGRVYLAGSTTSPDFPSRNSLQGYRGGNQLFADGFVARLSADGTVFDFVTHLGGTGDETVTALVLGEDGAVYVAGSTTSEDFPTTPGSLYSARIDTTTGRLDAFVVKLSPDGDAFDLGYATYLGGVWDEIPNALAVDEEGRLWMAGMTNSDDFPTRDPLQDTFSGPIRDGEGDVFLARLNEDASALDFSTYLGGNQDDEATGLALDAEGRVYLTGWTMSNDFPTTPGAYQTERQGLRERFLARFISLGTTWMLDYATRLSAPGGFEMGRAGLAVDQAGRVWVAGATNSDQFPTVEAEQAVYGGGETDAFLARLDATGAVLGYATYLGGSQSEVVTALALGENMICTTGGTGSSNFPTRDALQAAFDGPQTAGLNLTSVFVTCFETVNQASVLTRVAVLPDSVGLIAQETVPFMAEGFDQFDQSLFVHPMWTATGGTIDSTGRYTAGDDAGLFTVTATDSATGLSGTALINIFSGVNTEDGEALPTEFALYGNYPNPFNPQTTIRFDVKAPARVVLTLYDVLGRRQATLLEKDYAPGRYEVRFDGRGWPSGVYFYAVEMGDFRAVKKMLLVR